MRIQPTASMHTVPFLPCCCMRVHFPKLPKRARSTPADPDTTPTDAPTSAGGASPVAQEQQQQDEAIDSSPLAGLLHPRRLQPAALRVFDFAEKKWIGHSLTRVSRLTSCCTAYVYATFHVRFDAAAAALLNGGTMSARLPARSPTPRAPPAHPQQFPPELPVARWAVASLLNRAKKKESSVFLVSDATQAALHQSCQSGFPPRLLCCPAHHLLLLPRPPAAPPLA